MGTVEWFGPFLAPFHEGEPPLCWASPAHFGSMQQCPLRYVGVPPTIYLPPGWAWTLRRGMPYETGSPRPSREVDRGRHDLCGFAAIPVPDCHRLHRLLLAGKPRCRLGDGSLGAGHDDIRPLARHRWWARPTRQDAQQGWGTTGTGRPPANEGAHAHLVCQQGDRGRGQGRSGGCAAPWWRWSR
jgi:hypothetical protein